MLQLGMLLFAVRAGGMLAKKANMPAVLGELLVGVLVGPYALGSLPIPGFPGGLFPLLPGEAPIGPALEGFSTVASILLLFSSGLETDLPLFLRYSLAGGIVGLGGAVVSFFAGAAVAAAISGTGMFAPQSLFLGIMCMATSVGITARILSDRKKMDSPEGVTILAAAVLDDVLGIIALAVVMCMVAAFGDGAPSGANLALVATIAFKAFGLWLGFTAIGLLAGRRIAGFLAAFGGPSGFATLSLGSALLLAGFFETQGLAMIIGAYIAGLSLSKTDLSFLIQERLKPLHEFFIPVFFAVMGMLVDTSRILSPGIMTFGLLYTLVAVLSKIGGCAIPSLALGFNARGALRIGIGMVPRGEVALIIAGIGLSTGILDRSAFGVAVLMTMVTTLVAPPALGAALAHGGRGTRKPAKGSVSELLRFVFPSREIADIVADTLLRAFQRDGFRVQTLNLSEGISHVRRDDISITLVEENTVLVLETAPEDSDFAKAAMHETLIDLDASFDRLKESYDPGKLRRELGAEGARKTGAFIRVLDGACLVPGLGDTRKEDAIRSLLRALGKAGSVEDEDAAMQDVLAREARMSTGMQHGIAMPHARTRGVARVALAIGVFRAGVDFATLDGSEVRIVALILSPASDEAPHMQTLAGLGAALGNDLVRARLVAAKTPAQMRDALSGGRI